MTRKHSASPKPMILPGTTVGGEVGTFYADFTLWNPGRTQSRSLSGLVDTGASYSMIPAAILDDLDIGRVQTLTFRLANGSTRDLDMGWSDMELGGLEARPVYVVFGTDSDRVLLGAMALEAFALAADAKNRRLIPAELTL